MEFSYLPKKAGRCIYKKKSFYLIFNVFFHTINELSLVCYNVHTYIWCDNKNNGYHGSLMRQLFLQWFTANFIMSISTCKNWGGGGPQIYISTKIYFCLKPRKFVSMNLKEFTVITGKYIYSNNSFSTLKTFVEIHIFP